MNEEFYTINDLVKLLKVSRTTIYEYMDAKDNPLPVMYLSDRTPRVRKSDFESWIKTRPQQSNIPSQQSDSSAAGGEDSGEGGEL